MGRSFRPCRNSNQWTTSFATSSLCCSNSVRDVATPGSHGEGFPAAATGLLVRVQKLESLVESFAHEVDLRSIDILDTVRVNEQLHAMLLHEQVVSARFVDILHLVRVTGTARSLDTEPQADALATFLKIAGDVAGGPLADGDVGHAYTLCLFLKSCMAARKASSANRAQWMRTAGNSSAWTIDCCVSLSDSCKLAP